VDRLFLDANVLFSAAYRPDAHIARLWLISNVELMTSLYAAEEARVNLMAKDQRQRLAALLERVGIVTSVSRLPPGVTLREKDRPILQAAIQASATHLLTGDKRHFGKYFGQPLRRSVGPGPSRVLQEPGVRPWWSLVVFQALVLSICSACLREVSVSLAPLSIRATSSVRSSPVMRWTLVRVRPAAAFFSIR